jgi:hypothetical protein
MNRYVKGVFGGILAILAAFGWTVAIAYLLWWKPGFLGTRVTSISLGPVFWIVLCLIFSVGFYVAFPAIYGRKNSA